MVAQIFTAIPEEYVIDNAGTDSGSDSEGIHIAESGGASAGM